MCLCNIIMTKLATTKTLSVPPNSNQEETHKEKEKILCAMTSL